MLGSGLGLEFGLGLRSVVSGKGESKAHHAVH